MKLPKIRRSPALRIEPATLLALMVFTLFQLPTGSAQSNPQGKKILLPPPLARVLSRYETAWRANDAVALSDLFAQDGFVLPPGGPVVRGRKAIRALYRGEGGPLFLHPVAFEADVRLGYIIGTFSHRPEGPDDGKFVLTLRKDVSGEWLILSDMDNGIDRR